MVVFRPKNHLTKSNCNVALLRVATGREENTRNRACKKKLQEGK